VGAAMAISMPVLSEMMPVEPVLVEIISRQSRITFFYEENLIDQIRVTVLSGQSSKYFPSGYDSEDSYSPENHVWAATF
jgi:hypothetical protein